MYYNLHSSNIINITEAYFVVKIKKKKTENLFI